MLKRTFKHCRFLLGALLPLDMSDPDTVKMTSKTAQSYLKDAADNDETGWDRLYFMFSMDEFGNMSPELNSVRQAGLLGLFVGVFYGGVMRSRTAYLDFIENNQATAFKSHFDAKRKLQDKVTVSFGKGAFQWGWRLGLFTTSYVLITTTIAVYRGKSSMVEYITAGTITGALYKCSLGLRGIVTGGILGGILGSVGGGVSLLLLKMSGMSMEEIRYWQYKWKTARDHHRNEALTSHIKIDPLLVEHNKKPNTLQAEESLTKFDPIIKENKT